MYQFVHVNSCSRTLSKKAKHHKWNAGDVVAEATRQQGAIPHIDHPEQPTHVYGEPIESLLNSLDEWAANTKDAQGRSTRKDAVCLLAGVFSVPADTDPAVWEKVKADSIQWALDKYGDRLKTVVEHKDEAHPHCHFYVIPRHGEAFNEIHEGRRAEQAFVSNGGDKKQTNAVYRKAMRGFQDEYFRAVGVKNGMVRMGPGKRRLSRPAWKAEQQQAKAFALMAEEASRAQAGAKQAILDATKRADEIIAEADAAVKLEATKAAKKAENKVVSDFSEMSFFAKVSFVTKRLVRENKELKEKNKKLEEHKEKSKRWLSESKKYREIYPKLKSLFKSEKDNEGLNKKVAEYKLRLEESEALTKSQAEKIEIKNREIQGLYQREIERREEVRAIIEKELKGDNPESEKTATKKHGDSSLEY